MLPVTDVDFEVIVACMMDTNLQLLPYEVAAHAKLASTQRQLPSALQAYYELLQHSLALLPIISAQDLLGGAAAPMITSAISSGVPVHTGKVW